MKVSLKMIFLELHWRILPSLESQPHQTGAMMNSQPKQCIINIISEIPENFHGFVFSLVVEPTHVKNMSFFFHPGRDEQKKIFELPPPSIA